MEQDDLGTAKIDVLEISVDIKLPVRGSASLVDIKWLFVEF